MRQPTAPPGRAIKILSGVVLALTGGLAAAVAFNAAFLIPAMFLGAIVALCYVRAPIAYDLSHGQLSILYRLGAKRFGPVTACSLVDEPVNMSLRLWGNGGLFAATGIFWNKKDRVFRAYITAYRPEELVRVDAGGKTIYISPQEPRSFVDAARHAGG